MTEYLIDDQDPQSKIASLDKPFRAALAAQQNYLHNLEAMIDGYDEEDASGGGSSEYLHILVLQLWLNQEKFFFKILLIQTNFYVVF